MHWEPGVSLRAIAQLEDQPEANPTLRTLNRVFAPFGGQLGLIFPKMEAPADTSEEVLARRSAIEAALAQTRRRRRSQA